MSALEIIGLLLTAALGLSIGLIGAGGSILTVPVFVYLFGIPAERATGLSLLVVGTVALVGAILSFRRGDGDVRVLLGFTPTSLLGAWLGRREILPMVPKELPLGSTAISRDHFLMLVFAALMTMAALAMRRGNAEAKATKPAWAVLSLLGFGTGLLTGFLGAGGGFLIVPALALLAGLEMRHAVATSMGIIAAASAMGFTAEIGKGGAVPWTLLGMVSVIALGGLAAGMKLRAKASGPQLKQGFSTIVLVIAAFIVVREVGSLAGWF